MPSLHLRAVSFAYSTAVPVLAGVDLDLADGWVGVVGPNGAGKSTLLDLVAGELVPTSGSLTVVADLPPVRCPQRVEEVTPDIQAFAWDWEDDAPRLRSRLALDPDDLDRWSTLSPGERKRWQVGAALAGRPDVLLLDEPTNHLDAEARALLLAVLRRFTGVGLVVSHDRELLNELTGTTVRVSDGGVVAWAGGYDEARRRWREAEAAAREAHDRARREERRARRILADARRARAATEAAGARERRQAGAGDADVRGVARQRRMERAEGSYARATAAARSRHQRAAEAVEQRAVTRDLGGAVVIHGAPARRSTLLALRTPEVRVGDEVLLRDVDLAVGATDRIWIAGPNGAGKTTLLSALLADGDVPPERVAVLPQELTVSDGASELAAVRALDPEQRGRVLGIVATLGVDPDRVLGTDAPSPGEARKLALARALGTDVRLVALDEPTNHLDLPAIEALESAVAAFPGAVVVVTHDAPFAAATTRTRWTLTGGTVEVTEEVSPRRP